MRNEGRISEPVDRRDAADPARRPHDPPELAGKLLAAIPVRVDDFQVTRLALDRKGTQRTC